MLKFFLKITQCEVTGEAGSFLIGRGLVNDGREIVVDHGDGTLAAHHIVEHYGQFDDFGPLFATLAALGVAWFGRGQMAHLHREDVGPASPYDHIRADVVRLFCERWRETEQPPNCSLFPAYDDIRNGGPGGCRADFAEDADAILSGAKRDILADLDGEPSPSPAVVADYVRQAHVALTFGMCAAADRYDQFTRPGGNGPSVLADSDFWAVADAVRDYVADNELLIIGEGLFTVYHQPGTGEADAKFGHR